MKEGHTYVFRRALRVVGRGDKDDHVSPKLGYYWGKLHVKVGQEIKSKKGRVDMGRKRDCEDKLDKYDDKSYHIIGSLGHGATSNIFHALDPQGKVVALKVYVKNIGENGKAMDKIKFLEAAKTAVTCEGKRLLTFYPFLKDQVKVVELLGLGLWCIVMPLFEPIEKKERERTLPCIKSILGDQFKGNGLKYKDDDVRWRHVGWFTDKNEQKFCILYDLADLEEDKNEDFVSHHLNIFQSRCQVEEKAGVTNFFQGQELDSKSKGETIEKGGGASGGNSCGNNRDEGCGGGTPDGGASGDGATGEKDGANGDGNGIMDV